MGSATSASASLQQKGLSLLQGSRDTLLTFPTSLWENSEGRDKISVVRALQGPTFLGSRIEGNSSDLA